MKQNCQTDKMNNDTRRRVSAVTLQLQCQKTLPLWSLINEEIIYSIATNQNARLGKKGQILFYFIKFASFFKISNSILFFSGLIKAGFLLRKIKKKSKVRFLNHFPKRIFWGFGASSENYFLHVYQSASNLPCLYINGSTGEGMDEIGHPSFFQIVKMIYNIARGHHVKIRQLPSEFQKYYYHLLTLSAINIGVYAFYRIYWQLAKKQDVIEVNFLAPDISAAACADENLQAIYTAHGLITLSVVFPRIKQINVLTRFEEAYFRKQLKHASISYITQFYDTPSEKQKVLLIVLPRFFLDNCLENIQTLVQWALSIGLLVVFRPTNSVTMQELDVMRKKYPDVVLDDFQIFFEMSYKKWNPVILAAWSSTSLAIALENGTIPVNLHQPSELYTQAVNVMIYPMYHCSFFWPSDADSINQALSDEKFYIDQITRLRSYHDDCL